MQSSVWISFILNVFCASCEQQLRGIGIRAFIAIYTLECGPEFVLYNGTCLKDCPDGFYSSENDLNQKSEETYFKKNAKCVQCHYTCRNCLGPMDYQCTDCFKDAELYTVSNSESYCYPVHLIPEILSRKWYSGMIILISAWLIVFLVLYIVYLKRHPKGYMHISSEVDEIREIERNIKAAVYSDEG